MNSSPTNKGITENNSLFADVIYRDILSRGIGCIFNDVGFGSVEKKALNTTVHMVANCKCKKPYILSFIIFLVLNGICESAKKLSDHSGRTEVTLKDVQLSLDTMGIPIDEFCLMLKNMQTVTTTRLPERNFLFT